MPTKNFLTISVSIEGLSPETEQKVRFAVQDTLADIASEATAVHSSIQTSTTQETVREQGIYGRFTGPDGTWVPNVPGHDLTFLGR